MYPGHIFGVGGGLEKKFRPGTKMFETRSLQAVCLCLSHASMSVCLFVAMFVCSRQRTSSSCHRQRLLWRFVLSVMKNIYVCLFLMFIHVDTRTHTCTLLPACPRRHHHPRTDNPSTLLRTLSTCLSLSHIHMRARAHTNTHRYIYTRTVTRAALSVLTGDWWVSGC